ncbi:nucleolin-like isoform X2 [Asparagus officinalis]|uniref:nucleolin-like isoform X1 n=1 Tax=Asparagus officinalis TaxID=4686 RepID=UPI00098E10C7|nr:nucleolin-like isoform X1 [Asparagus officinalis]XP_020260760.1 nucleolin-like isoform X2 [Asparagus officinalis]
MPPKSKTSAKRASPLKKKATPSEAPSPLPAVAEESDEISTAAILKDDAPPEENEIAPMASLNEEKSMEVKEEAMEEKTAEVTAGSEKTQEEIVVEKIVEETTVEKIEKEVVVEETVTVKAPMEGGASNVVVPEVSGEAEDEENEAEDEENEAEDKEVEESEEEESEEEEEEEEKEEAGEKQIAQEETGEGEIESISGDDEENDEDDPAMYISPMTERKKQKEFELFIGGLDKGAVDSDLVKVFGVFGEIQSVRIVKHPSTQKSKGFAFLRYANIEHTKKALAELKDGIEVKGKKVMVSASQDNDTLYLGNICKTWTRDHVLETLKGYGIEQIEDVLIPDDPKSEGKIKGFAFLEFKSHSDAMTAFQRLRKPDAVFGRDISAKVGFAQAPLHPCEEDLMKVKTVYVEGFPKSWDEAKLEELCNQYGEIEKVQLFRKRKDFGFVGFFSRDSAVACVEGINNTQFEEGINVKANLAKPVYKGRLAKQSRGGFKVQKDADSTEEPDKSKKNKGKSKAVHDKKKPKPNFKSSNKSTPSKSQDKNLKKKNDSRRVQSAKGQKRGRKDADSSINQQPPKRARRNQNHGRRHDRSSTGHSNYRSSYPTNPYTLHQTAYAPPATSYTTHIYPGASVTQPRHTHLEPHAGYLPAANQVRHPYEYEDRRAGAYSSQPRSSSGYVAYSSQPRSNSGYVGASTVPNPYPGYSSYAGYETGYVYPSSGAYAYQRPPYY